VETENAGLAGAEKFAGAAEFQVSFGDFETVARAHHGVKAGAGFVGHTHGADQNAVRFLRAPADAAAELMELREAETLGVLDDHYRGVANVDADFDDGSGYEDLDLVLMEAPHDIVFFIAGEATVQEAEAKFGENFVGQALVFFDGGFQFDLGFFNHRINDVGLAAGFDFAADTVPNAREMRFGGKVRFDGGATGREFVEDGDIQITVESER